MTKKYIKKFPNRVAKETNLINDYKVQIKVDSVAFWDTDRSDMLKEEAIDWIRILKNIMKNSEAKYRIVSDSKQYKKEIA